MKFRDALLATGFLGAGVFAYGALFEARRLVVEKRVLRLPLWPAKLNGYKIAVLADLHVKDHNSLDLAKRAVALALEQEPDVIVLAGDIIDHWTPTTPFLVGRALDALDHIKPKVFACLGNRDYSNGDPHLLKLMLDEMGIKLLRNQSVVHDKVTWVGIDSAKAGDVDMVKAFDGVSANPIIVLWHEPDLVGTLPRRCALQISGHSHGGQFVFPFGYTPMHTSYGEKYVKGFYESTSTPLYVSRGIGTTFLPSRLNCAPEVSLLELQKA